MKKLLLLSSLLLSFGICAETFSIAGKHVDFKESDGLLLHGCEGSCEALKLIKRHGKVDLKEIRKGRKFHSSAGSEACDHLYQGEALLGSAMSRDRRAFCRFKDGSLVEVNSLTDYLYRKKIVRE